MSLGRVAAGCEGRLGGLFRSMYKYRYPRGAGAGGGKRSAHLLFCFFVFLLFSPC